MKKITTAFIFCFLFGECFSQAGEWVWIKGDSIPNQPGSYGMQGVPSPTNNPPSLYEPCEWTDLNGNFWLFGGQLNFSGNVSGDLWKYNPSTNEWTWMKGSGIPNDSGSYGIFGVPSINNNPPARTLGMNSWTDNQGNLWVFGGYGGSNNNVGFSDLWKYDLLTNEWTWMKGLNGGGGTGIYGIQGIPDSLNYPPSRIETATSWTDNMGNLWLFGGHRWNSGEVNDLWRYNIASSEWTWMKGDSASNSAGNYGIQGVEDPSNSPGSRMAYCHWKDITGNLWLFAGWANNGFDIFNDLWKYNVNTNNWTWMNGSNSNNSHGLYGIKCDTSFNKSPRARFENRCAWKDYQGNFWFYGGYSNNPNSSGKNDLWKYCLLYNKWIWIDGDSIGNPSYDWGIFGVSSPNNKPKAKSGAVGWSDINGHLFLFGGYGYNPGTHIYNDLWKYTIDTTCGVCPAPNSIQENNFTNELLVFPNPTNSSFTISFSSSEKQIVELRIYNTLGQLNLFQSFKTLEKVFSKEINVEKWINGVYFLQLRMKESVICKKIIVQQ